MELYNIGDSVAGKRLIGVGRKISAVEIVSGTAAHRAQRITIKGWPAKCYVDLALRKL